ncbi:MAG: NADH-quinone oxidoreductase subunit N [Deltaproteobacteria bacterium]
MNELRTLWLPLSMAALAVLVLLVDVMSPPATGKQVPGRGIGWLVAVALFGLFVATFYVDGSGTAAHGAYRGGAWALFLQRLFLVAGCLGALGGIDHVAKHTPRRQGEYWLLMVFSLVGMVLLPGARSLVLIIVCFELMSVPLYVLAAYGKTDASGAPETNAPRTRASEAALKLYLVGATSTAVTMFGLALVTGMTGTTDVALIGAAPVTPLSGLGLVFVLAGLGYKIGMVPFHMWVPDTYQGAATPFVAFLSVAPKAAGISVLSSIFVFGMAAHRETWMPPLAFIAFLSMGVGNLLALPQTDLRRLLGYSGIAQMGYVLVALATGDAFGMAMVLFFLTAYLFTNLGVFLVVHAAAETSGNYGFESLYGLAKRAPGLAVSLLCFLLSLAGIPFVVGFWAKLYVFLAAWRAGLVGLVVAGIVLAVLGLFYYLRMLRAAYMVDSADLAVPKPGGALRLAIALCLAAVVGLGLWPRPLVESATRAGNELLGQVSAPVVAPVSPVEANTAQR